MCPLSCYQPNTAPPAFRPGNSGLLYILEVTGLAWVGLFVLEVVRPSVCQQWFLWVEGSGPGWEVGALFLPGPGEIWPGLGGLGSGLGTGGAWRGHGGQPLDPHRRSGGCRLVVPQGTIVWVKRTISGGGPQASGCLLHLMNTSCTC